MNTDPLDPEKYLYFHYGKKEQYTRLTTIAVMAVYSQTVVREILTPVIANQSKAFRQLLQITAHDPLYRTACEIKIKWITEGMISQDEADSFGAYDIWVELMEGLPEDLITAGMFVPRCGSNQDNSFKQN